MMKHSREKLMHIYLYIYLVLILLCIYRVICVVSM